MRDPLPCAECAGHTKESEYYCYDPASQELSGWHLQGQQYIPLTPGLHDRLWSNVLQLWLGTWEGVSLREAGIWLRFFEPEGQIVPTAEESVRTQAEAERQRAEPSGNVLKLLRP